MSGSGRVIKEGFLTKSPPQEKVMAVSGTLHCVCKLPRYCDSTVQCNWVVESGRKEKDRERSERKRKG